MRVQIPVYTDRWMMGDRYGEIIKTTKQRKNFPPRAHVSADNKGTYINVHHVKLDKSGRTIKVWADDCEEI
jgi:hypothetical protein